MKKIHLFSFFILGLFLFVSCGGSKKTVMPADEVEINMPCYGPEFMTNEEYFRASAMGESTDMMLSQKKALTEAKTKLAASISTTVKAVTDNYASSHEAGNVEDIKERYETISREVVKQELNGIRVLCQKQTKTKEGKYRSYVAIELAGDEIAKAMQQRISKDEKLMIDFQYEKFKKELEKEMENFGS